MRHAIDQNDLDYIQRTGNQAVVGATPCPINPDGKINPNVTRFHNIDGSYTSVVHIKPVYYETIYETWRPLSEITTHHGNHRIDFIADWDKFMHPRYLSWLIKRAELINGTITIPSPFKVREKVRLTPTSLMLTSTLVHPDPHAESTSVDGGFNQEGNDTWANIRGAASATAADSAVALGTYVGDWNNAGGYRWCYRSAWLFDTSGLSGDTVDSGIFSVKLSSIPLVEDLLLTNKSMRLVTCAPASNTALVNGDYDSFTTTANATDVTVVSGVDETYSNFTLNATGEGNVDASGITKFGLRHTADALDEEPFDGGSDDYNGWNGIHTADASGTSNDPKLSIQHSAGAGGGATPTPTLLTLNAG